MSYTNAYINRIDEKGLANIHQTMRRIEKALIGKENEFDVVVVTGMSGAIPGGIYSFMHGKQLVVVRKDDDTCHGLRMEGSSWFAVGTPYIILDDFVSGGNTMRRVCDHLRLAGHGVPQYMLLYDSLWWSAVRMDARPTGTSGVPPTGPTFYLHGQTIQGREHLFVPRLRASSDDLFSEILDPKGPIWNVAV